jgi:hypothetical protein
VSGGNYGITVGGSFLNHGGVLNARKGTVTFDGAAAGLSILSGGQRFNAITIAGTGPAAYTLADRFTASGTLTLSSGSLDVSSTGNYAVKAGTITQTAGTLVPRSGVVILTSPSDATATILSALNTLRIEDPTESGLVGYWKFDEGTNTGAILDSSGAGNTGVRHGGTGKIWSGSSLPSAIQFDNSYAMQFDGADDFVSTALPAGVTLGELTVVMWINASQQGGSTWKDWWTLLTNDNKEYCFRGGCCE